MEKGIGKVVILLFYVIAWILGKIISSIYEKIRSEEISDKLILIISIIGAVISIPFCYTAYKGTGEITDYIVWVTPLLIFGGLLKGMYSSIPD